MQTTKTLKLSIGGDHAGYEYKTIIKEYLTNLGHSVIDFGTHSADSVDYPDYVHPLAKVIGNQDRDFGILICGSANGVAMTANKYQAVRAAICWQTDIAKLARQHNNANVICLPARFVDVETAIDMVTTFINTDFEGGRHQRRVSKIPCM